MVIVTISIWINQETQLLPLYIINITDYCHTDLDFSWCRGLMDLPSKLLAGEQQTTKIVPESSSTQELQQRVDVRERHRMSRQVHEKLKE
jgi:hypothetical protein